MWSQPFWQSMGTNGTSAWKEPLQSKYVGTYTSTQPSCTYNISSCDRERYLYLFLRAHTPLQLRGNISLKQLVRACLMPSPSPHSLCHTYFGALVCLILNPTETKRKKKIRNETKKGSYIWLGTCILEARTYLPAVTRLTLLRANYPYTRETPIEAIHRDFGAKWNSVLHTYLHSCLALPHQQVCALWEPDQRNQECDDTPVRWNRMLLSNSSSDSCECAKNEPKYFFLSGYKRGT